MFKIKRTLKQEDVEISVQSIYEGHNKVTYKGIKAIRCPFDYVIYQMMICELKPDLIIEIGTRVGGGALYLADLLDGNENGVLHTIDIKDEVDPKVKEHKRITFFYDGWENYDIGLTKEFKKILIIEDSSHSYIDTLGVLNKFCNIVSVNSYFIIEDGIINQLGLKNEFKGGPLKAIREFLPNHSEYIVDMKWYNMFGKNATFNVNGYLKKVK